MINREHPLPLLQQFRILNLSRSGIYYLPVPVSDKDRELMRLIDEIHLECPYAGTRVIRNELWNKGHRASRTHVRTLMREMGIEALYRKPRLVLSSGLDKPIPACSELMASSVQLRKLAAKGQMSCVILTVSRSWPDLRRH